MHVLFILSGALCAVVAAILSSATPKEFIYFLLLILFFTFLLAFLVLSVAKFYISRIEFLNNTKIVAWGNYSPKKRKFPFVLAIALGLLFGALLILQRAGYVYSLLLALALSFEMLGWQICALKRFDASNSYSFILAHMGAFIDGKLTIFNGSTSGITKCEKEDTKLNLTILNKKKESLISLEIPNDKLDEVDVFLKDMKEFFDGEE